MLNGNIVLIGFMGSGKSSVGSCLSKILNMKYISTDDIIEEREKMKIRKIFKEKGEKYFREKEKEVISEVSNFDGCVIATGGGIVLNWDNVENLRKNGTLFFLKTKGNVIYERIKGDKQRPLLSVDDPISAIRRILKARLPLYKEAADWTIDTSSLSISEVADRVIKKIKGGKK
ncbi:MAG: shikimate kinase [bacterium]